MRQSGQGVVAPLPPLLPPIAEQRGAADELFCYECPWLPCSCVCTGFRELLMLAAAGKKSDRTICSRCLALDACLNLCKVLTLGNGGMSQLYDMVDGGEHGG